jgi:hypothetical protein
MKTTARPGWPAILPAAGRDRNHSRSRSEKERANTTMNERQDALVENDAHPAEDALNNHAD